LQDDINEVCSLTSSFLMVLHVIFMLLSLSYSTCTVSAQEQMSGTFDQDGEPCTKSLSQGQSAWIGRLLLNQAAVEASTFESLSRTVAPFGTVQYVPNIICPPWKGDCGRQWDSIIGLSGPEDDSQFPSICVCVGVCVKPRFQALEGGCLCENLNPYKSVPKSKVSSWTLTRLPHKYDGGLRLVGSPCRACSSHSLQYGRLPTKLPLFGLHVPPSLSQRELLGSLCPVHPSFPTCMSAAAVRCCTCSPCQSTQNRSYCTCSFQENVMACELLLAHEIGGGVHLFRAPAAVGLVHTICQVRQGQWRWSSLDGAGSDWRFS